MNTNLQTQSNYALEIAEICNIAFIKSYLNSIEDEEDFEEVSE